MPHFDHIAFLLNHSAKMYIFTFFYGQTSNIADDDDEDDTKVTYRSSLPELKNHSRLPFSCSNVLYKVMANISAKIMTEVFDKKQPDRKKQPK